MDERCVGSIFGFRYGSVKTVGWGEEAAQITGAGAGEELGKCISYRYVVDCAENLRQAIALDLEAYPLRGGRDDRRVFPGARGERDPVVIRLFPGTKRKIAGQEILRRDDVSTAKPWLNRLERSG